MDSAEIENEFKTHRLTARSRPVLPRSRSCETFHEMTPTGEISIRVNQDQWPSQVNFDRYDKDDMHPTDNRSLSSESSPSRKVASDQAKNPEVSNRATVVHLEKNAARTVKQNFGEESRTLLVPLPQEPDHAYRTDEINSNSNYTDISNEPIFERDYDINLQNTRYYKKKPALYDWEGNWEDYLV
ncbi:unnamed protein product [Mytilus coruscus]|uniref:Uncharacterized protein n=1 Tax=Mytilus coruscus TaxID=42192 RepID=A0A6J8B565_MYTCO|nr:unnamed protein product [Mytilus coruscus]